MGQVKDAVKGPAPAKAAAGSLRERVAALCDEVSGLIAIKDNDALHEGSAERSENQRKAALLRACFSLLRATGTLLDDY